MRFVIQSKTSMNDPLIEDRLINEAREERFEIDQYVRRNPTATFLMVAGIGLGIALLIRAIRPEPTARDRAERLLEELEDRLRDAISPVIRQASSAASNGADAVQRGVHGGELKIERFIRDARKQVRRFFT